MSGAAIASTIAPSAQLSLQDGYYEPTVAYTPGGGGQYWTLGSGGTVTITAFGSYPWLTGDDPSLYQARFTTVSGTYSTGPTLGTWLTPGQTVTVSRTTIGTKTYSFTVEIRKGTGPVLVSATVTIAITVESGA
jgi:hypothetical protein